MSKPDYKQIALIFNLNFNGGAVSNRELARWLGVSEGTIRSARKHAKAQALEVKEEKRPLDIDEIRAILENALELKANAGGAIKAEIRKALDLINYQDGLF